MTRQEKNEKQREYRIRTNNSCTRNYEKTKSGFLVRMYRNMKSRITGVQWKKKHLYSNKELISKEQFYEWANNNNDFHVLFSNWEASKYNRKLAPSIDRIDSDSGYTIENIRFVTFSENCRNVKPRKSRETI
jgi:hypothetical protein